MKLSHAAASLVFSGFVWAAPHAARADVIQQFHLTGTFQLATTPPVYPAGVLDAVFTIDTTTGNVLNATGTPVFSSSNPFPMITQGFDAAANAYVYNYNPGFGFISVVFDTASLVGYTGGALASLTAPTSTGAFTYNAAPLAPATYELVSGVATLVAVPEPASAALLAGALGVTAMLRRRRAAPSGSA